MNEQLPRKKDADSDVKQKALHIIQHWLVALNSEEYLEERQKSEEPSNK